MTYTAKSRLSHDRPPGLAPKGTSWGLGLMSAYAPGVPALTIMAASPWLPGGVEAAYPLAILPIGIWLIIMIPLVIGFKARRYWGVVLFFWVGVFCAVALPIASIGLALLYFLTLNHRPPEYYMIYMGGLLIPMLLFWPLLIRTLRLKYWQPWTRPDEWEVGNEVIANWVFRAAGVEPPNRERATAPPTSSKSRR